MRRALSLGSARERLAQLRPALARRLVAPELLRALLRRLAPILFVGIVGASLARPAAASDWNWFYDDAGSHLSYSFDASTLIFKDQRVRVWVKIYKSSDSDETPLDRVYQEVNCTTNRVRILMIRPRPEGDDEDSLPITPFSADAAVSDRSPGGILRRAVCTYTRPETARSSGGRERSGSGASLRSGRSDHSRLPAEPPNPPARDTAPAPAVLPSSQAPQASGGSPVP